MTLLPTDGMTAEQLPLWLVVTALVSNLLFAAALYTYRRRRGPLARRGAPSAADPAHDGVVPCPDCEAGNERGYRFCRACVRELPVATRADGGTDSSLQRLT